MPPDPSTLANKVLWLRAKDLGSGSVTSWTDQSGGVNNPMTITNTTVVTGQTPSGGKIARLAGGGISLPDLGLDNRYVTATASSIYSSSYLPHNLNDGNTSNRWIAGSTSMPQWVRYKITGGAQAVNQYTITAFSGEQTSAPSAWTFEGSNDATNWTTLDTQSGISWGTLTQTFTSGNSTAYLYYRLNMSARAGGSLEVRFAEWNLSGVSQGSAGSPFSGEMWMVVKSNTTNGNAWSFGTSGSQSHYSWSGSIYDDFGRSSRSGPVTPPGGVTTFRLYRVVAESYAQSLILDNTVLLSSTAGSLAWRNDPSLANNWSGDIAEVLIRSQVSTLSESADLTTYFNSEHGLSVAAPNLVIQAVSSYLEAMTTGTANSLVSNTYLEAAVTGVANAQVESQYIEVMAQGTMAQTENVYAEVLAVGNPYARTENVYAEVLASSTSMQAGSVYTEALVVESPNLQAESVYTEALVTEVANLQIESIYTEVLIDSVLAQNYRGWGVSIST